MAEKSLLEVRARRTRFGKENFYNEKLKNSSHREQKWMPIRGNDNKHGSPGNNSEEMWRGWFFRFPLISGILKLLVLIPKIHHFNKNKILINQLII